MTAVVKLKPSVAREMESEIGELRLMVRAVRNAWFDSLEHIPRLASKLSGRMA